MSYQWTPLRAGFRRLGALVFFAGLGLMVGCQTISPGGVPSMEATLTSDGQALLGSESFPIKDLSARLKSDGAGRATAVFLVLPPDMKPAVMSGLLRDLRKAGFLKIVFKRPMKPDATIRRPNGVK